MASEYSDQAQSRRKQETHEHQNEFHNKDLLHNTIDEVKERSEDIKILVEEYVKSKPFKSLGIAVMSGVALALLLKR